MNQVNLHTDIKIKDRKDDKEWEEIPEEQNIEICDTCRSYTHEDE